ncbi:hypothetical protein QEG73_14285 [Chitinophagaceae bacterium 26-R-25]|nr:hypothetical protein [Chitinophagaceae bacterium 26-R-25]
MALPVNNKGKGKAVGKNQPAANGSKFIAKPTSKVSGGGKKVVKTGGSRGS